MSSITDSAWFSFVCIIILWHWNGLLCADVPLRNCSLTHSLCIISLGYSKTCRSCLLMLWFRNLTELSLFAEVCRIVFKQPHTLAMLRVVCRRTVCRWISRPLCCRPTMYILGTGHVASVYLTLTGKHHEVMTLVMLWTRCRSCHMVAASTTQHAPTSG